MNEIDKLNKRLQRSQAALRAAEDLSENKLRDAYYAQEKLQAEIENRKIIEHNLKATIIEKDKALSVRTQFLQNISHKLKTPMNGIIGMTEVLDSNREGLNEEQTLCLDVIQECSDNLLKMIENTIQYAQLTTSIYHPSYQVFHLREMLNDFIQFYLRSYQSKNININYQVSSTTPNIITTDKTVLIKILKQLLNNAIKFSTPESNIVISVASEYLNNNPFNLLFDIVDTGEGFPNEVITQFSKETLSSNNFLAHHAHSTQSKQGIGIGLTLCHIMLNNVGKYLQIKANTPSGSIVSFSFPAMLKEHFQT